MEFLWTKESDDVDALYIDLFKNVERDYPDVCKAMVEFKKLMERVQNSIKTVQYFPNIPIKFRKHNQTSTHYRNRGNQKFKEEKWFEAMDLYNESLCTAEIGTENVSMAYANRSAIFFHLKMYEKCIVDIELAKQTDYPSRLMPKLHKRLAECSKLLHAEGQCIEFVPKLSFEGDEQFTGMANVLGIENNEQFGRHITAKCDIDVGRTVLIEEQFISPTTICTDWKNCMTCLKLTTNLMPCGRCTVAMFCSRRCIENNKFHEMECDYAHIDAHDYGHQVLRSIFVALNTFSSTEELMEFVEDTIKGEEKGAPSSIFDSFTKYRAFLNLNIFLSSENKCKMVPETYKVYRRLLAFIPTETLFETKREQRFLMHLVAQHICVIISNSFAINYVDNDQCSLSLIKSHFNHSCAPNLFHFTKDNRIICITSRPIKKGDQLFIIYKTNLPTENQHRQKRLHESFGFQCKCEKCEPRTRSIESDRIRMDPEFQHLVELFATSNEEAPNDLAKCLEMKNVCIKVLNKYGSLPWNDEIDAISDNLYRLLSNEVRN